MTKMYQEPKTSTKALKHLSQSTVVHHQTKVNSVRFEDQYDQINPMDNNNYGTRLIGVNE